MWTKLRSNRLFWTGLVTAGAAVGGAVGVNLPPETQSFLVQILSGLFGS